MYRRFRLLASSLGAVALVAFSAVGNAAAQPSERLRAEYDYSPDLPDHIALKAIAEHVQLLQQEHPDFAQEFVQAEAGLQPQDADALLGYLVRSSKSIWTEKWQAVKQIVCPVTNRPSGERALILMNAADDAKEAVYLAHHVEAQKQLSPEVYAGLQRLLAETKGKVYYRKTDNRFAPSEAGLSTNEYVGEYCQKVESRLNESAGDNMP